MKNARRRPAFAWLKRFGAAVACGLAVAMPAIAQLPAAAGAETTQGQRRALVIGNGAYPLAPLANPANDARLISQRLSNLGFDVQTHLDLGKREFRRVLRDYVLAAKDVAGTIVFYYAGHGVQIEGRNYLLPIDIDVRSEDEVRDDSVDIDDLLISRLEGLRAQARIVILDACRDDPFPKRRTRGIRVASGLAEMAARGTLIAYASAPGATAEDGDAGGNSVYTRHLAEEMLTPGIEIEQLFKRVRVKVLQDTRERQIPWVNTSLTVNFSFRPAQGPSPQEHARLEALQRLESELAETRAQLDKARERLQRAEAASRPAPSAAPVQTVSASSNTANPRTADPQTPTASAPPPQAGAVDTETAGARAEFLRIQDQLREGERALAALRAASDRRVHQASRADDAPSAARATPPTTGAGAARSASPVNPCADLVARQSLGESLTAAERDALRRDCR